MGKEIGILAVLVCLIIAFVAPAFGTCVEVYDGEDGTIASDGADADGGEYIKYTNDGVKATLAQWVKATVKVPEGTEGYAYAKFTGYSNWADRSVTLNGENYELSTNYDCADVNVGAEKYSTQGVQKATALVKASVQVDNGFVDPVTSPGCKKNALYGYAEISGTVESTGTGTAYALAKGDAGYFADRLVCCDEADKKALYGYVSGCVDLEDKNWECLCEGEPGCACSTVAPAGTKTGAASIYTESFSNNRKSYSNSKLTLDLSAKRTATGTSYIDGFVRGYAGSAAWDGTTPQPWYYYNPNVRSFAEGCLNGHAVAYAAGDLATSKSYVKSNAIHNSDTQTNYNVASDDFYVGTTVKRTSSACPAKYTSASAYIDDAFSNARSEENGNGNQYAEESMDVEKMASAGQLQKINNIYSNADLSMTATRSGATTKVNIKDVVNNVGPHSTTNNDKSFIYEEAGPLSAKARSGSKYSAIYVPDKCVNDLILGTSSAGGSPGIALTSPGTSQKGWNNAPVAFGPFNFVTNAGTYSGNTNIWKAKLDKTITN